MSDPEEMVEVDISATLKMRFNQRRKIPKSVLDKYDAMCDRNARYSEFEREFGDLINVTDPYDWDDMDDIEIEPVVTPAVQS